MLWKDRISCITMLTCNWEREYANKVRVPKGLHECFNLGKHWLSDTTTSVKHSPINLYKPVEDSTVRVFADLNLPFIITDFTAYVYCRVIKWLSP